MPSNHYHWFNTKNTIVCIWRNLHSLIYFLVYLLLKIFFWRLFFCWKYLSEDNFCWKYLSDDRFFYKKYLFDDRFFIKNIFLTTVFLLKISFWQLFFFENIFLMTVFLLKISFWRPFFCWKYLSDNRFFCWKYLSEERFFVEISFWRRCFFVENIFLTTVHAWIHSPGPSNEDKVSCIRKQWEPLIRFQTCYWWIMCQMWGLTTVPLCMIF